MDIVKVFDALGNETRYEIVQKLKKHSIETCCDRIEFHEGAASVGDVVKMTGLAQSTISQHIKVLEEAGLITREKRGQWTCFTLNEATVKELLVTVIREFYS